VARSKNSQNDRQLVVARQVMERRKGALQSLALQEAADAIMHEDKAILSDLAKQ